jgi:hypothetical protein
MWRVFGLDVEVLGVFPVGGGFDIEGMLKLRQPGLASRRRLILLKGFQGWYGRALFGLRAIEISAEVVTDYEMAIY